MTFGPRPMCFECERLVEIYDRACAAFPAGIPRSIWFENGDHTTPIGSDGGLVFVQRATPREPLAEIVVPTPVSAIQKEE
jgi:hypothetical protein